MDSKEEFVEEVEEDSDKVERASMTNIPVGGVVFSEC
jgi:hypothetical protein